MRFRNREIGEREREWLRGTIIQSGWRTLKELSQIVCAAWDWRQPNDRFSEFACRDLLLRLEQWGQIDLGVRRRRGPVLCRRVSQGNRSLPGARAQAILMSLFRSRELQGRNPVDQVPRLAQSAVAGKPISLPLASDETDQIAACPPLAAAASRRTTNVAHFVPLEPEPFRPLNGYQRATCKTLRVVGFSRPVGASSITQA